jgi:hypothetical protein
MKTKITPLVSCFFILIGSFWLINYSALAFYNNTPYAFTENMGQWDDDIKFAATGNDVTFMITDSGIKYDFYNAEIQGDIISVKGNVVSMNFKNGTINEIIPMQQLDGKWNYFYGNDPDKWISNSLKYKSLLLRNTYPGINTHVMFDEGNPRYDFVVLPGADPDVIEFSFSGMKEANLNEDGNIVLTTSIGNVMNGRVFAYQVVNGIKREVDCNFEKRNDAFGFLLDDYDKNLPLVIDPIVFASYFGGTDDDEIIAVANVDDRDFVVCGWTKSMEFVTTEGAYQRDYSYDKDIFISKFRIDGFKKELVFSTLIGFNNEDYPTDIGLDMEGNIYVCGATNSSGFPCLKGFSQQYTAEFDGILTKFSPDGSELLYSSVYGGSRDDICTDMQVTSAGYVFAVGYTMSSNFPTKSAYQNDLKGNTDAFFFKTNKSGTSLENSTYFGGNGEDKAFAMSIDNSEKVYFTGYTMSDDFPAQPLQMYGGWYMMKSPFDHIYNGGKDAFITNLTSSGGLVYSTFFGGKNDECGTAISANDDGSCYMAGWVESSTTESEFPISQIAIQKSTAGKLDGFIVLMDALREEATQWPQWKRVYQDMVFCTYLGGNGDDNILRMKSDLGYNSLLLSGKTSSSNFYSKNPLDIKKGSGVDAFFTAVVMDGSSINFSTVYGGGGTDIAYDFAIDDYNNILLAGSTSSEDFPQANAIQETYGGGVSDGYFIKSIKGAIMLTSPITEDEFCLGGQVNIRWNSLEIAENENYLIEIKEVGDEEWSILQQGVTSLYYRWDIPEDFTPGEYELRVSHVSGAIAEMDGGFVIKSPPSINSISHYPDDLEICEGGTITFTADASGDDLVYQWRHNGTVIQGVSTNELILSDLTADHSGNYDLVVSGSCNPNATSQKFNVNVIESPTIKSQCDDITVMEYEEISLYVEAEGDDLEYLWKKNGELIIGADKANYVIVSARKEHKGKYQCFVSNSCGEVTSQLIDVEVEDQISVEDQKSNDIPFITITILNSASTNEAIEYTINSDRERIVRLSLIDNNGSYIMDLYDGAVPAGISNHSFNSNILSSGIYWIRAVSEEEITAEKVNIVK